MTGILPVSQERALRPVLPDPFGCEFVDLLRCNSRTNKLANFVEHRLREHTRRPHQGQILFGF
jgi:hypothetical protein